LDLVVVITDGIDAIMQVFLNTTWSK
jgi:hypothetical protein